MPFIQRVVQPVNIAQVVVDNSSNSRTAAASVSGSKAQNSKIHCIPGKKCANNNCINKQDQQQQQTHLQSTEKTAQRESNGIESTVWREQRAACEQQVNGFADNGIANAGTSRPITTTTIAANVKDTTTPQTTTITTALIHTTTTTFTNGFNESAAAEHNHTNGFVSSFSYATDNEDELTLTNLKLTTTTATTSATATTPTSPPATLHMKKLKQHVEFLSSAPSPSRNHSRSADSRATSKRSSAANSSGGGGQQHRRRTASAPHVPPPANNKIVTGYEFDSISNITLSNALRQLASLVLIASDIFDDLQKELQSIGDRALGVQRKIVAVEQRVCAYDPKMVTVPESDLLTFAQRKIHYQSDKLFKSELFTAETRPHSVRQLYEDAGKITPPPAPRLRTTSSLHSALHSPMSINGCADDVTGIVDITDTGVTGNAAAGSDDDDELVCTPVFGRANRTMRTRIDSEIEIRLPAAIDDLRKWTSAEALGDVTVTPDCMHHVDTSICTSINIGDNGVLTPALSPSVLSADAVDALYSINVNNINDNTNIPNEINKDVPLNHRLPSPEEQCKIIALRYPAEVISVDTSGKRFQRMCLARKSTTGCYTTAQMTEANNLNDDVHTVSRRSRSRKVRGKRRNTIAGIDQKEIQDAANGDTATTSAAAAAGEGEGAAGGGGEIKSTASHSTADRRNDKAKKFGRSKSSDILKKESVALPYDKGKSTLTRLNSLKQWGRNRFKFMQRQEPLDGILDTSASSGQSAGGDNAAESNNNAPPSTTKAGGGGGGSQSSSTPTANKNAAPQRDIDDECRVHDLISKKSESRFSHERKPSYSSSEKSMSVSSSGHLRGKLHLATCGGVVNVKLRDTSSLNRQRRNGISALGFGGGKDEQPHSSSGNWSASSESGRASIGSEITIQPKSSASNTSLNVSSFHPGSGPPSSMLSRRRFMNTSASSSVTSEGTATPDLQVVDLQGGGSYPNHMDDETSSAYSCDTEGYYTSFHMDSGLRTLKEEEPPATPQQSGGHNNMQTSNYSFGSQSNQTVLTAENEYELFGRGSTSTTTSSAGTVCTTLMINGGGGEQSSLGSQSGPDVPERISSLGKLNRSSHSNSASTSTLERSYSSSTIGSTLERTGTIKRNTNAGALKLATNEVSPLDDDDDEDSQLTPIATPESQDAEFDFEHRIRKRAAQPLPPPSVNASLVAADMDCSESSDLECVERIERIKQKTTLNAKRIPSMCIITPTTSDDENHHARDGSTSSSASTYDPNKTLTNDESSPKKAVEAKQDNSGNIYSSIVETANSENLQHVAKEHIEPNKDYNLNVVQSGAPQTPRKSVFDKIKVVLPSVKRSPSKVPAPQSTINQRLVIVDDDLYADAGEYVYITDISNNNRRQQQLHPGIKAVGASGLGIYYSNDIVRQRKEDNELLNKQQQQQLTGNRETTEYVSLNELPLHLRRHGYAAATNTTTTSHSIESEVGGKLPYCADSLNTHTSSTPPLTAAPGTVVDKAFAESSCPSVPMYAEISELREEKTILSSSPLSQHSSKYGARVRLNAQGKIIYESDSLKRRKGAHTTFAPGPYVKETESALTITTTTNSSSAGGDTVDSSASESQQPTKAAKLLLLNGGIAATRKIANVRPIVVATAPQTRLPLTQLQQQSSTKPHEMQHLKQQPLPQQPQQQFSGGNYHEHKQMLANSTNPFFQHSNGPMMPSPSTKSTSSTGSSVSSSTLTSSSSGGSGSSSKTSESLSSRDEGYQRSYKTDGGILPQEPTHMVSSYQQQSMNASVGALEATSPFQRNTPVYWTLQNRRQNKPMANNAATSRDDLYATPIKRSERVARAAAAAASAGGGNANGAGTPSSGRLQQSINNNNTNSHIYSPIIPRNRSAGFSTSTPNRSGSDADSPDRLNICADRIGQSKTSLMDFKKLLLAKSAKNSPVQRKLSAVELLKKTTQSQTAATTSTLSTAAGSGVLKTEPTPAQSVNSSMKLLDLSGSPKTFANRRMLRQGQFGSPSKTFVPKAKQTAANSSSSSWRSNSVQRTDIMSTAIPEATNSEEDPSVSSSGSSSGTSNSSRASSVIDEASLTSAERFDLKRNFFLQTDENNFMRGELKPNFGRSTTSAEQHNSANHKFTANTLPIAGAASPKLRAAGAGTVEAASATPALETAL